MSVCPIFSENSEIPIEAMQVFRNPLQFHKSQRSFYPNPGSANESHKTRRMDWCSLRNEQSNHLGLSIRPAGLANRAIVRMSFLRRAG